MKRKTTAKRTTTRKRSTAKKNNLRPLFIGAAVIGGGYLAYQYLIKPMLAPKDIDVDLDITPPADNLPAPPTTATLPAGSGLTSLIQTVTNLPAGTVKIDMNKTIKPGDPASPELKASKQAFNDVMDLASKSVLVYNPLIMKISRERLQSIADLRKGLSGTGGLLDTSTGYGEYSQKVAGVILGKTTFNLYDVRSQRGAFYVSLGLKNPY